MSYIENISAINAKISELNSTWTPLAAGQTWTGPWEETTGYPSLGIFVRSDTTGTHSLHWSTDGVNIDRTSRSAIVNANDGLWFGTGVRAKYFRVTFTNTSDTDQQLLKVVSTLSPVSGEPTQSPVSYGLAAGSNSQNVKAAIAGQVEGSATAFKYLSVDANGYLNVNTSIDVGSVTVSNIALPDGAATEDKQPALGTAGTASTDVITIQGILGMTAVKVDASGATVPVSISNPIDIGNFPGTQEISGVVEVSNFPNFPETQTISGTVAVSNFPDSVIISSLPDIAGHVTVDNFPTVQNVQITNLPDSQTISGSVSISNLPETQPISGSVEISNFPDTQIVTGSVSVSNFPAFPTTQSVSGTISVSNFPTTQTVSGTVTVGSLPTVTIGSIPAISVSNFPSSQAVTGTFWQATQPISASSLPLPSGASTAAKQPTLGTAGTSSTDVLTIQGITGMTAVKVDGSAVTQPVSISSAIAVTDNSGSLTVDNNGTFAVQAAQSGTWNVTNISGTISLPSGASTAAKQPALGTAGTASSDVLTIQGISGMTAVKVDGSSVTQPISGSVTVSSITAGSTKIGCVSLGNSTSKTVVMKAGSLTSSATTADQTILTYTVTTGKTFYLQYCTVNSLLGTILSTLTNFGTVSLDIGGTKMYTTALAGGGFTSPFTLEFAEPIPVSSATVIKIICTPSASTSFLWYGNFGGYEI